MTADSGNATRRRSPLRLRGFDYAQPGAYFVTLCTHGRESLFGVVVDGVIRHSAEGEIVGETWLCLPNHYLSVEIDAFVIMPNHVHGIVILRGHVGAGFKPAPTNSSTCAAPVNHRCEVKGELGSAGLW
jgi:putative transposase